jgi:hypothetical protein
MAKNTVNSLISDIKLVSDYNITDTDLNNLIIIGINFAIKRMKQWFMDEGLFDEIGAHDTLATVANQEYIDIADGTLGTVDLDQPIKLTERTNDNPIDIVPFDVYRVLYPDPTADKASTPEVAAFFANRLYLGPTPSGIITLYLDYVKLITKVVAGGTLPYEDKYDELIVAICLEYLKKFLDDKNTNAITQAGNLVKDLKHDLIVGASKNIGTIHQSASRRESGTRLGPKMDIT